MSFQETHEIRVRGTVQGVGFRPTVYRLAAEENLVGEVFNDAEGVLIRVSGHPAQLSNFVELLGQESPPLAKIDGIESRSISGDWDFKDFSIRQSEGGMAATDVSADAATCSQCLEEVLNPQERRHLYPFTNCTHCGPRITIVKDIPYDRKNSTMAAFPMCDACRQEYEEPLDRRFHAQPIACFDCGPKVSLIDLNSDSAAEPQHHSTEQKRDYSQAQIDRVVEAISDGKIIAIRGIGGFHLCCDASNDAAVATLRRRKQRYAKPFALMTHDLDLIRQYCEVSAAEADTLASSQAPIVLLEEKHQTAKDVVELSPEIAPGSNLLGFMMPYTPLHWLVSIGFGKPLVMTSGNLSKEPQITGNQQALAQLATIADLVLCHDRDIANRIDDSVVRFMHNEARVMRRARGYAPRTFQMPEGFSDCAPLLACGAELKSTFCLLKNGSAMVSQHQGDLEDVRTFDDYVKNLGLYEALFDITPEMLVVDKHPEYISTKFAKNELAARPEVTELVEVQHHHAHIASCLVENQVAADTAPVLGVALDGLGYGDDGSLWGGEFLLADYRHSQRVARFKPIAMIGGAQAIKEPWRNSYAQLLNAMSEDYLAEHFSDTEIYQYLQEKPLELIKRMLEQGINSPLASSCGRLFDAVAAILGLCRSRAYFEGQGAIELEMRATTAISAGAATGEAYKFAVQTMAADESLPALLEIDPAPMIRSLLHDISNAESTETMAARFHMGLVDVLAEVIERCREQHDFSTVALSGGCLQNKLLLEGLHKKVDELGLKCLSQRLFPANDGGISLGQAAIAAARSGG